MLGLRKTTAENPLSQEEVLQYIEKNPSVVFEIEKIKISVVLSKVMENQVINTVVVARDGRVINETSNKVHEGDGVDTRICVDGRLDQYVKKPEKINQGYDIDDGRSFGSLLAGEATRAHTKGGDVRKAFVVEEDLYLKAKWGVQFVGRGGLVTFRGKEAIGNNNPCDMVLYTPKGKGEVVLVCPANEVRKDAERKGLVLSKGAYKFLSIAHAEDVKRTYISALKDVVSSVRCGVQMVQERFETFLDRRVSKNENGVEFKKKKVVKVKKEINER